MNQNFFADYFAKLQEVNQQWWKELDSGKAAINSPLNKALNELNFDDTAKLFEQAANQPSSLVKVQMDWWERQLQIWQNVAIPSKNNEPVVKEERGDKRFVDEAWQEEAIFNFIKQSYLLFGETVQKTIDSVEGLDDKAKERLSFFSRQAINAMSPSNFINTNPELFKLTMESNGQNLVKGMELLQEDMQASSDVLKIRMTNSNAFKIGQDIANTEGSVVFKNELFELIQYKAKTDKVNKTPILVVPPFINKYYILDLREKNSMMRWLVEQGHTVFLMSWRNPDRSMAKVDFEDYVLDGVVKAVDVVEAVTGEKQMNAVGYCIGGTLLATTTAYYAARRMRQRFKSTTYFTTILDFAQPGEIGAYVNEQLVSAMEAQNNLKGYLDGRSLSVTFSLLRENSLYWNYYIDNYLKGNSPVDFDLLYWNSDSTNVTAACHNTLLRRLYLENSLVQKQGIKVGGVWIDLEKIKTPSYFISTKDDHIALWEGTYRGAQNISGDTTFVLGESGHIAGIVNHPAKNKYGYYIADKMADDAQTWLDGATHHEGSWWTHWNEWLAKFSPKEQIDALEAGSEAYPVIGPAPGVYVQQTLPIKESVEEAVVVESAEA
ncbi:class I poly(R)-hydroxyalkanoic acid synthase [Thaumasiovibrio subtropicus]|uniref:class I poly(R)-hydroxyalkanoic acid synthase n=1 Tax=Thaumasiovibrio subtropicus TaxID=1891207 RepID=UPI000B3618C2|nr:class I poly(R)-hydroxyalkanoic acid synthase [Thaumasiovibrio subtropicus]